MHSRKQKKDTRKQATTTEIRTTCCADTDLCIVFMRGEDVKEKRKRRVAYGWFAL
jgi:hypothetical protein